MAVSVATVTGKVVLPDGSGPSSGTITATLSVNGKTSDGGTYQRVVSRKFFPIASDGAVDFSIVPNDLITPAGSFYTAKYRLLDSDGFASGKVETWEVNGASAHDIGDLATDPTGVANPAFQVPHAGADRPTPSAAYARRQMTRQVDGYGMELGICMVDYLGTTWSWVSLGSAGD